MKSFKLCLIMVAVIALAGSAFAGTLEDVRAKGFIQAGVNGDLFGFGKPDEKGVWKGLDVDTARAVMRSRKNSRVTTAVSGPSSSSSPAPSGWPSLGSCFWTERPWCGCSVISTRFW